MAEKLRPQKRKVYEMHYDGKIFRGEKRDIAKQANVSMDMIANYLSRPSETRHGKGIGFKYPVYKFYRGWSGEYAGIGTIPEMSEKLNVLSQTLSTGAAYRKTFTGKYKIVEDDDMITRRTINKVAPVPVPEKYEPERKIKVVTTRPVEMKAFKFKDKWINYQLDTIFKGW